MSDFIFFGEAKVYLRPADPRDGNEWEQIGTVVPPTPVEEAERILAGVEDD